MLVNDSSSRFCWLFDRIKRCNPVPVLKFVCTYECMYIFKTYWFLKPEYWEPDLRQVTLNQSSLICKIHIAMEPLISTLLNKINCIVFFFKITFLCWLVWEYKWLNIMASIEGGAGIDKVTLCAWFFFFLFHFF